MGSPDGAGAIDDVDSRSERGFMRRGEGSNELGEITNTAVTICFDSQAAWKLTKWNVSTSERYRES